MMTANAQTSTTPCDATRAHLRAAHVAWLHPKGSVGRAWVGTKVIDDDGERFEGETLDPADAVLRQHAADDRYSSLNRFWGRRRTGECLKSVGSLVLDWDYQRDESLPFYGWAPEAVRDVLIEAMVAAGIPLPSIWVASGCGLQGTWACDGVKAAAWARVRAVYDALHGPDLATNGMPKVKRRHADRELDAIEAKRLPMWRVFRDAGVDRVCRDSARVVRLVGSMNVKSGSMARLIAPASFSDATRHTFHALADAILPVSRREIEERRRARAEAQTAAAANDNSAPARPRRHAGPAGRWVGILRDLHAWRNGMGGPPKGKREIWLFLTANATAHVRGGRREDWAAELAPLAGLTLKEAISALGTLDRRQRRHEAGETDEFKGVEQTVLYNHAAATMVDLLDIQVEQAERFGLRPLFPGGGKAMTPAERQQARRRRLGIESASDSAERRLWIGMWALGQRTEGWSLAEICAFHEHGKEAVLSAMRLASDEYGLGGAIDVETLTAARDAEALRRSSVMAETQNEVMADATGSDEAGEPVGFASRYIVGSASREARPASQIVSGPIRITRFTPFHVVVETGTGRWSWTRYEGVLCRGWTSEWRLETDRAAVSPEDAALAEQARQDIETRSSIASRSARRRPGRDRSRTRQAAVRRAPLPPLDLAREAEAYLDASGGWSTPRRPPALVAA
ncbi:hypothetical protein ACFQE0_14660 [Methylobacterium komagatae]|uniref:Uncharacterized protein n=1 Tax=Methylobacterium komagatae TaxID=374425 RepID=A0ABW2BLI5_9HYPH